MDFNFELDHMNISTEPTQLSAKSKDHDLHDSTILNDLTAQIEDLQTKLKLSYRKLFLFETENQKLQKEKNFYFYEKNNLDEYVKITSEKIENLNKYTSELELELAHTTEKMKAFENLNKTQSLDLKRLTKFYSKIQNIIKPYIQNLKSDLKKQIAENEKLSRINFQYLELTEALNKTNQDLSLKNENQELQHEFEKKNLISSYEEQIHFLSKEIIDFQQKISYSESEIQRLKKSNETKNFLENEVVKFKRMHSEDQEIIQNLKLKLNETENTLSSLNYEISDLKKIEKISISENENQKTLLDSTRRQLHVKIEENEKFEIRLKMLERLNSHLSAAKDLNFEEHQTGL